MFYLASNSLVLWKFRDSLCHLCLQVSMPYDALALMRMLEPETYFEPNFVGKHSLTGHVPKEPNLKDVSAIKDKIVAQINSGIQIVLENNK